MGLPWELIFLHYIVSLSLFSFEIRNSIPFSLPFRSGWREHETTIFLFVVHPASIEKQREKKNDRSVG